MSCTYYLPLISRLLDGEVSLSERAEIENHLESCVSCRQAHGDWQQQGQVLRGFFTGAALDEAFVQKVGREARVAAPPARPKWPRVPLFRWAQAIAAVAVIALVVVQFFPSADQYSLGKVINAGDGLEVSSSDAPAWSAIAAGALIKAGDWIRNPQSTPAQVLLLNSFKLTFHHGALAQVSARGQQENAGQLALLSGTVSSEGDGDRELQLRTAAGAIRATKASFDLHLDHVALPNLVMAEDRSEILNAAVLPVAGVRIGVGSVRVEVAGGTREIGAGNAAFFTPTQLAVVADSSAGLSIAASLQPDRGGSPRSGLMSSSLVATDSGLLMQVRADGVPLKRLLEATTGEIVAGAAETRVTGNLVYPVQSSDESIVAAIGNQLGITIAVAQQAVSSRTASLDPGRVRLVSELDSRPEYSVRKSSAGALSFSFKGVAASRVFNALRSESVELPQISQDDSWVPVTVEGSELEPAQVGAFLEKELGLVMRDGGSDVRVVHVGGPAPATREQAVVTGAASAAPESAGPASVPFQAAEREVPSSEYRGASSGNYGGSWWATSRVPVAASSPAEAGWIPATAARTGAGHTGTTANPATATVTGKVTSKDSHPVQNGARHLTWPVLPDTGLSVSYTLSNELGRRITTIWRGYDSLGGLIAIQEFVLEPRSSLSVVPGGSLVALGPGGHWETFSDSPLFYVEDSGMQPASVAAIECDNLPASWEFETGPMGLDGSIWFTNPLDKPTTVVLAVTTGGRFVSAEHLVLAPHSAESWTIQDFLLSHPEFGSAIAGGLVVLQATEGAVAADVVANSATAPRRGKTGDWVY